MRTAGPAGRLADGRDGVAAEAAPQGQREAGQRSPALRRTRLASLPRSAIAWPQRAARRRPGCQPRTVSSRPGVVARWWSTAPRSSILLVTGRIFDVLDVPASAGSAALARLSQAGIRPGPV